MAPPRLLSIAVMQHYSLRRAASTGRIDEAGRVVALDLRGPRPDVVVATFAASHHLAPRQHLEGWPLVQAEVVDGDNMPDIRAAHPRGQKLVRELARR